jgi:hypothetical protein
MAFWQVFKKTKDSKASTGVGGREYLPYDIVSNPPRFPELVPSYQSRWLTLSILFLAVMAYDYCFGTTELITPISPFIFYPLTALGAFSGLWVGYVMNENSGSDRGRAKKIMVVSGCTLLLGGISNSVGWRIVNHWEFAFSNQSFSTAYYPIARLNRGRRGRHDSAKIDPFDTWIAARIPITDSQYLRYQNSAEPLCLGVKQRVSANGAVQIKNNGRHFSKKIFPVDIKPCSSTPPPRPSAQNHPTR